MRNDVLCMMRIKNEGRWIARSLERTFEVCRTVVIFDDHSTDNTKREAVGANRPGDSELYWYDSPFQETVNEVRDKNYLWNMVCDRKFRHVLCLDGDEMLSRAAVREFGNATNRLEQGAQVCVLPFIYLWNDETHRRIDGVYHDIRHARLFTIDRSPDFRTSKFVGHGAGFHCGSIPDRLNFGHRDMPNMPIVHFGYLDDEIRRRKLTFYNELDPDNEGEGYYKHIVGEPNHLAPGPVKLVHWEDV